MLMPIRSLVAVAAVAAVVTLATEFIASRLRSGAEGNNVGNIVRDYLAQHPEDVLASVKDYLVKNPEALERVIADLSKPQAGPDMSAAIKSNSERLFSSSHQVTLGNPNGNVTMVEFFDYNCGYCRRALGDMMALIKDDPNLKVVLKEFPVLGSSSVEAARVAVAVRMQDPGGQKYLTFHQKLMSAQGPANKDTALEAAKSVGLDMERLQKDMTSDEVNLTLDENLKLAQVLEINGTPHYVIGNTIVPGAVGVEDLKARIAAVRDDAKN